jgi:hypothetical protein
MLTCTCTAGTNLAVPETRAITWLWPHARTVSTQKRLSRPAAVRFDETQRAWSDSTIPLAARQHSCHSVRRRPERAERTARNAGRIVSNPKDSSADTTPARRSSCVSFSSVQLLSFLERGWQLRRLENAMSAVTQGDATTAAAGRHLRHHQENDYSRTMGSPKRDA